MEHGTWGTLDRVAAGETRERGESCGMGKTWSLSSIGRQVTRLDQGCSMPVLGRKVQTKESPF